ncbi:hypothetical protein GCM10010191_20580 [Actinomadura vinacea]|uniref:Uncharacterized protein n=1 Tax=Actinomadura vinacea TaxID=115336 RepID=A0ABP5VTA5_9ACTN
MPCGLHRAAADPARSLAAPFGRAPVLAGAVGAAEIAGSRSAVGAAVFADLTGIGSGVAAAIRALVQYAAAERAPALVLTMPLAAACGGAPAPGAAAGLAAAVFAPARASDAAITVIASVLLVNLMKVNPIIFASALTSRL